jgi:MFS transporter, DHA2 family, multidrug resistance protein
MLAGIGLLADSMLRMAVWTPDVSESSMITTSIVQGFGFGLVFTPLSIVCFATLPVKFRVDGTAFFSLVRNVGSAIGISVTSVLLTQNTQIVHSQIAANVTPFNRMLQSDAAYLLWNPTMPSGVAALNAEVTRQASIIAYADDFKFLFFLTLSGAVLVVFMRPSATAQGDSHAAAMHRSENAFKRLRRRRIRFRPPASPACCDCRKTEPITATDAKPNPAQAINTVRCFMQRRFR